MRFKVESGQDYFLPTPSVMRPARLLQTINGSCRATDNAMLAVTLLCDIHSTRYTLHGPPHASRQGARVGLHIFLLNLKSVSFGKVTEGRAKRAR